MGFVVFGFEIGKIAVALSSLGTAGYFTLSPDGHADEPSPPARIGGEEDGHGYRKPARMGLFTKSRVW
jgi:hypothetical protein